jgi:hypothetical protein
MKNGESKVALWTLLINVKTYGLGVDCDYKIISVKETKNKF